VIFQNSEDRDTLLGFGALRPAQAVMIRGSGVDLARYVCTPEPPASPPIVVMASRLLYDKGVREFVEAARLLRGTGIDARFLLAGDPDFGNPAAVSAADLTRWRDEGVVECIGHCGDMPGLFAGAHLVVLPSYREGLPKVLVEAAACGRAVVTTDVAGCRDAVVPGETGMLVQPRNVRALVDAIAGLLANPDERQRMGAAARRLAEREFAVERIVDEHMQVYGELLDNPSP
jgi:glycosyltransferase involved in cell wall biosynthesis